MTALDLRFNTAASNIAENRMDSFNSHPRWVVLVLKKSRQREKKRANNNQSIEAIEKSTKARILNTIADAIHQRRSLFGSTISNVRKAFAAFDRDGDGFISQNEFRSAVRRLGLGLSEIQTTACFDVLRSTGSTSGIDYHDFTQALQNRRDSMIT